MRLWMHLCAPSKAQRCLLNCKSILVHLQHHLDLQVCTQPMCTAVEHHFAHLSQCKARDKSDSCEYCLRVEERQLIRSVDFMEAEVPEAEAKVQKIINDITASFTNHPDEREQEMIQLEDELEQVEENKRELVDKLNAARHDLRKVRKNFEHRGCLPLAVVGYRCISSRSGATKDQLAARRSDAFSARSTSKCSISTIEKRPVKVLGYCSKYSKQAATKWLWELIESNFNAVPIQCIDMHQHDLTTWYFVAPWGNNMT